MRVEVEVERKETGEIVATAVEHGISVTGRTEKEALALLWDQLERHFKRARKRPASSPS